MTDESREFTNASFNAFLAEEKTIMGVCCQSCGNLSAEPRSMCPACHGKDVKWFRFSGRGHLSTFTCISIVTNAMGQKGYGRENPCCSGIITLEEGPRISAQIIGVDGNQPQGIKTGTKVLLDLEEMDPDHPALAFRPV